MGKLTSAMIFLRRTVRQDCGLRVHVNDHEPQVSVCGYSAGVRGIVTGVRNRMKVSGLACELKQRVRKPTLIVRWTGLPFEGL
jgi:hypothetical protein